MIGVLAREDEQEIVKEFFELFKTPWEPYRPGCSYDVVVSTAGRDESLQAGLVLAYGSDESEPATVRRQEVSLTYKGNRIPVYGHCLAFEGRSSDLSIRETNESALVRMERAKGTRIRVGYDLFEEVRHLLTTGQPASNAGVPTLDWHITLLRDLIVSAGLSVVEIPPVPAGYAFTVCLTHDVDHPVLRNHKLDHTAFGFLYRATVGSLLNGWRGRIGGGDVLRNWSAAIRFPLVQLGVAEDFWSGFDRYLEMERGLASTFYVIPRSGDAGRNVQARHSKRRAARYELADIQTQLDRILADGGEIGLHGIDAWTGSTQGRNERDRIATLAKRNDLGVRMHWLCFGESSPLSLEQAGFAYDSTFGYNDTVGYRAGTLQAFKLPGTMRLIELPLHIMDTALFYADHLNLSPNEARQITGRMISDASRFGGALTVNWHDRSIAPERLWGGFYMEMLDELKQLNPWFATAANAVAWFRLRRSAVFEEVRRDGRVGNVRASVPATDANGLPGLRLRVSRKGEVRETALSAHRTADISLAA